MTLSESILIALFCMSVVFGVLILLWGIIRVFSSIIRAVEQKKDNSSTNNL